jgi:hypothetical protein
MHAVCMLSATSAVHNAPLSAPSVLTPCTKWGTLRQDCELTTVLLENDCCVVHAP